MDQYGEIAPKLKQGIEDWYNFSGKALEQYVRLQEEFWGIIVTKKAKTEDVAEQGRSFAQSVINFQKDLSVSAVDVVSKGLQSVRKQAEAAPTPGKATAKAGKKKTARKASSR